MGRSASALRRAVWGFVTCLSGMLLALSSKLTWFAIEGHPLDGFDDYQTRTGVRESPGIWLVVTGGLIALAAVPAVTRSLRTGTAVVMLVASGLGAAAVTWGWLTIEAYVDFEGGGDRHQPGLWVASGAALIAIASSTIVLVRHRRSTESTSA